MFRITKEESELLTRCKNGTMNNVIGRGANIKYLPHAFTEEGIYMLMTVLIGRINYERRNK